MPDLDDLLRPDVADAAARSAQPPDLATLLTRGRRLRARRRATAAAATCVLVAIAAGGTLLGLGQRDAAPQPTDPKPTPHRLHTPAQVVDDPASQVTEVVASPANPQVRGTVWRLCEPKRCTRSHVAIAVTGDGFATRALVAVPGHGWVQLTATNAGTFLVEGAGRRPFLLRPDGTRIPVGDPGPRDALRPGELLTHPTTYGTRWIGVDPATGDAHLLPAAVDGLPEVSGDGTGRLEAVRYAESGASSTYLWSDDGGIGWRSHPVPGRTGSLLQPVPSALPGTAAVLQGGDGATLFPFAAVHRSTRDGASWEGIPQSRDPMAFVASSVVLPDGRLLVDVDGWGDDRAGKPAHPKGPYVSDGDDWTSFTRVLPDAAGSPDVSAAERRTLAGENYLTVVGTSVAPGRATVYVAAQGETGTVYAVDGETLAWTPVRVR